MEKDIVQDASDYEQPVSTAGSGLGTSEQKTKSVSWYLIFWSGEGESFDETGMEDTVLCQMRYTRCGASGTCTAAGGSAETGRGAAAEIWFAKGRVRTTV
jgi:hypothetical protein